RSPLIEVPHFHRVVPASGSDPGAVRADGHGDDRTGVAGEGQEVQPAQALEVVPFPAATVERTGLERRPNAGEVAVVPVRVRPGDVIEVLELLHFDDRSLGDLSLALGFLSLALGFLTLQFGLLLAHRAHAPRPCAAASPAAATSVPRQP